ncbi:MAG: terpene cyclase/mutase family protein [Acidobacteriia bacterium]|nr:terpene cyclase/mutase family protein [Terriglobia bacterium]
MSIDVLVSKQNPDGGWPYIRGRSWTEPTVYTLLALLAAGRMEPARRGLDWILRTQRPDGGWPPQTGVDESAWVTALVALLPPEHLGSAVHSRAIQWLLGTIGQESTFLYRVRERLLGHPLPADQASPGWPWMPGAAAWVGPTALAVLALQKESRRNASPTVRNRIDGGQRFLLNHMCRDGGWNHGAVRALGYESRPYPETTGMGLAALRGQSSPEVERALGVAKSFLKECRSADGLNWLRLGLLAHGQLPAGYCPPPEVAYRTLPDASLELLVSGIERGHEPLWG